MLGIWLLEGVVGAAGEAGVVGAADGAALAGGGAGTIRRFPPGSSMTLGPVGACGVGVALGVGAVIGCEVPPG